MLRTSLFLLVSFLLAPSGLTAGTRGWRASLRSWPLRRRRSRRRKGGRICSKKWCWLLLRHRSASRSAG